MTSQSQSQHLAKRILGAKVLVIGDLMVDHYVHGSVERVSPEAPVPVLHVQSERHVAGGAANVAANVAALGGCATLVGIVGNDRVGTILLSLLQGVPTIRSELVICQSHPTITKSRYLGERQQLVRVDREEAAPYPQATMSALLARTAAALDDCDVAIVSDYGKGVVSDPVLAALFDLARQQGKPVIVDPKRHDFAAYRGATLITPNRKELEAAVKLDAKTDDEAKRAATRAVEISGADILLTRSEKGMSLFRKDGSCHHLPTVAREVFDVSGAGDTVVATLACSLGAGLALEEAMQLGNAAAGVVVAKIGTATCSHAELLDALAEAVHVEDLAIDALMHRPATWAEAAAQVRVWRRKGLKVGFANGCFDLLHPGHVQLLRSAAAAVDRLIVAINSDESVAAIKGPSRPVQNEVARAAVLLAIKGVDIVTIFSEVTPLRLIKELVPDVLFKGSDYRESEVVGADVVKAAGGKVHLIDLVEGQSTTTLVQRANRPALAQSHSAS